MALIKCNNCGGMVSDKATVCPHCGNDPHKATDETNVSTPKDNNPKLSVCPYCGATVSKRATTCPKCGGTITSTPSQQPAPATPKTDAQTTTSEDYEPIEEEEANGGLKTAVIILAIIFGVFAIYLVSGGRYYNGKTLRFTTNADTTAVDTTAGFDDDLESDSFPYTEENVTDTVYSEPVYESVEEVKEGFNTNSDVKNFVIGNSYYHNGVTLKITENGVYANDNKISSSSPVFKRVSQFVGKVTARPSISISIKWEGNKLVDNNSGDVYYEN